MSKLDRFLVTEGMLSVFPSTTAICLDRHLSNHRPILLHEVYTDYGPTPFRFYLSWFRLDGFDDMVKQAWQSFSHSDSNGSDMDSNVSRNEIRRAVWDCGDNKSPGPDGYSFEFFQKYWSFIGPELCCAVEHFFEHGSFSKGCNSSFIALIPKVSDAKFVSDFRPISLIGCVYKFRYLGVMVGELMSRRSAWDDTVNKIQSRLFNWKVKTLSIGGRLTLLKSVLGASP
nr:RNA-directed DNA polymerase, eukaryota [Tanacetum cinerariifolium]